MTAESSLSDWVAMAAGVALLAITLIFALQVKTLAEIRRDVPVAMASSTATPSEIPTLLVLMPGVLK